MAHNVAAERRDWDTRDDREASIVCERPVAAVTTFHDEQLEVSLSRWAGWEDRHGVEVDDVAIMLEGYRLTEDAATSLALGLLRAVTLAQTDALNRAHGRGYDSGYQDGAEVGRMSA